MRSLSKIAWRRKGKKKLRRQISCACALVKEKGSFFVAANTAVSWSLGRWPPL